MSHFLDDYIAEGFFDIIVVSAESRELSNFQGTEYEDEVAVAKKGDCYFSLNSSSKQDFGPKGSSYKSISPTEISRAEYERARADKPIVDTPSLRAAVTQKETRRSEAAAITERLLSTAPSCPTHSKRMDLKKGPKVYFWGCPNYPKCREMKWMSDSDQRLATALSSLPPPKRY